MLKTGALFLKERGTSFVLPYIDKFIRSSYGDKDIMTSPSTAVLIVSLFASAISNTSF